jgi:enhancing lycopene biosynthesis protein 2
MPHIGVILSGCGVYDGSEIHEATLALLALDQGGATYQCMAPNIRLQVVNHLTKKPTGECRNVLEESARIARGNIVDLATVKVADYDGFLLPGGFGAAKNLCTFAADGPDCQVDPHVRRVLTEAQQAGTPVALACIAPVIAAKLFGPTLHPALTIGHAAATAAALEKMGARHVPLSAEDAHADADCRILTTPAYMEAGSIRQAWTGIEKLVKALLRMV